MYRLMLAACVAVIAFAAAPTASQATFWKDKDWARWEKDWAKWDKCMFGWWHDMWGRKDKGKK